MMPSNTLVIQSHRSPLPYPWLEHCLESVRNWSRLNQYDYRFIGDELFDFISTDFLDKTHNQTVIATDLARLRMLQDALTRTHTTVIWLDADFLIFNPENFVIPVQTYAVGREIWVQLDKNNKLKVYKKVHNAFLMFRQNNSFLDFYTDTATRLLSKNHGAMPPQFIGPKLLTAIHNIAMLPIMETAGMLSPMVIRDIIQGTGAALDLFKQRSPQPISGANLCLSSREKNDLSDVEMQQLIKQLVKNPGIS